MQRCTSITAIAALGAVVALSGCAGFAVPVTGIVPLAAQEKAARQLVARCDYMTYPQRLMDRENFAKLTAPDRLVIYCEGDPDYPSEAGTDAGADR